MKKLILLLTFCSFLMLNSFAQVHHIIGVTRSKTPVYLKPDDSKTIGKLLAGDTITIEDANVDYFTIQYKGGNAYVERSSVKFKTEELRELKQTRKQFPFSPKPIDLNSILQKNSDISQITMNSQITDITKIEDKYKYEIDHIRYCAGKYRNEIMTGYAFSFAGAVATGSAIFMDNSDDIKLVTVVGFGLGLIGTILIIDSNKWMKKISVGPNGIGIKYVF